MKLLKTFESYIMLGKTVTVIITNEDGQTVTKEAKVDTGSYSSRISSDIASELKLPVIDKKKIKSSMGKEDRIFVECQLNIKGIEIKTQVGIADMGDLRNEICIGRKDIEMVDGLVDIKKDSEEQVVQEPQMELELSSNEALVNGQKSPDRTIDLRGPEGNAYSILAMAHNFTKQLSEVDPEKYNWDEINKKMTSSNYKNLVLTFEEYFGDYVTIYGADVLEESVVQKNKTIINKFNDFIDK